MRDKNEMHDSDFPSELSSDEFSRDESSSCVGSKSMQKKKSDTLGNKDSDSNKSGDFAKMAKQQSKHSLKKEELATLIR